MDKRLNYVTHCDTLQLPMQDSFHVFTYFGGIREVARL